MRSIAALLSIAAALSIAAPASAAPSWHDGQHATSYISNCITQQTEQGAWAWTGSYNDLNNAWKVGDVFYAHVVAGTVGNACAGQYASTEVSLPQHAQFAISAQNPVVCWLALANQTAKRDTADCPAQPKQGTYGSQFDPTAANTPSWPLPQGATVEIQFPVQATAPLNGLDLNSGCTACLTGDVWMLDGNSSPWLYPHTGLYVVANPPSISYPSPSSSAVTANAAHTQGYLAAHFAKGTVYTDVGPDTNYGTSASDAIDGSYDYATVDHDWTGLNPSTTYHWRLRFVPQGGTAVNGPDQTFTTPAGPAPTGGTNPTPGGGTTTNPPTGTDPGTASTPDPTTSTMPSGSGDTSTPGSTGSGTPASTGTTVPPPTTTNDQPQQPPITAGSALVGASVPRSIKFSLAAKKGVPATVQNAFDGSVDDVTLIYTTGAARTIAEAKAKTKIVGHVVKKGQKKGSVVIAVKLTKSGQKLLKGKRSAKLAVLIKASAAGQTPSSKTVTITLKH